MKNEILNILKPIVYAESTTQFEVPNASSTCNSSNEIRIAVQNQNRCLLPSKNYANVVLITADEQYKMTSEKIE